MKTNELGSIVGKEAIVTVDGLDFIVKIKDVKVSYGHVRYLVSPLEGGGERWTEKARLVEQEAEK